MKKLQSLISQALAAIILLIALPPITTTAVFNGGDGMEIAYRLEVCKLEVCTENDWYNFSGDLTSGNQTLVVSPGDIFKLRVKSWAPANEMSNVNFILFSSNIGEYVEIVPGSVTDVNADGDAISYTTGPGGAMSISTLPASGTQATAQSSIIPGNKIKSNVPDQTLIQIYLALQFIAKGQGSVAYAQFQYETEVRVQVTNPSPATVLTLPRTGASTAK